MKVEVHSAADFLMNLLRVKQAHSSLPEHQLQHFNRSLQSLLVLRFRSHWYPDLPARGSGYRCIRINGKMDPIVEQAGVAVGLAGPTLRKMLPTELTLWIDPEEVAYRIGENGSICVLYDSSSRTSPASDAGSAGSGGEEFVMERVGNKMLNPHPDTLAAVAAAAAAAVATGGGPVVGSPPRYVAPRMAGDGIRTPSPPSSSRTQMAAQRSPRLNHSVSDSPPMSPQYHGQQMQQHQQQQPQMQQHQQMHHAGQRQYRQHQQQQHHQQQHHHNQHHQQQMYGGERQQNMFHQWSGSNDDGGYGGGHMGGKVRSQC